MNKGVRVMRIRLLLTVTAAMAAIAAPTTNAAVGAPPSPQTLSKPTSPNPTTVHEWLTTPACRRRPTPSYR
jgi:hypothetical protein